MTPLYYLLLNEKICWQYSARICWHIILYLTAIPVKFQMKTKTK